jgi:hypothetical protein
MRRISLIQLSVFSLLLMLSHAARGQRTKADIVKLAYIAKYGGMYGNSYTISMEVKPDGSVQMFHDTYDDTPTKNLGNILDSGSRTISADKLRSLLTIDSLDSYYTGKLTTSEYQSVVDWVLQNERDTSRFTQHPFCGSHSSVRVIKVYFRNSKEKFAQCSGTYSKVKKLFTLMDSLANKDGYKKTRTKLKLDYTL